MGDGAPPKVNVRVPIKVVIKGAVDADRVGAAVESATTPQVVRALDATSDLGTPTAGSLDVTFKGPGAAALDEDQKRAYTDAAKKGVVRAAGNAGAAHAQKGATKSKGKDKKKKPLKPMNAWHVFAKVGDAQFQDALAVAVGMRFDPPYPSTYGVLFRSSEYPATQLWIVRDGKYVARQPLTDPNYAKRGSDAPAKLDPGTGQFSLAIESDGLGRYKELALKRATTQLATGGDGQKSHVGQIQTSADGKHFDPKLEADVTAAVDAYMRGWETAIGAFYWLSASGAGSRLLPFLAADATAMGKPAAIDVVSLVDEVTPEEGEAAEEALAAEGAELPTPADGGTGPDQQGQGPGGGGSGSDVTAPPGYDGPFGKGIVLASKYKVGGSIFPELHDPDARAVTLTCEPYDGEVSVDELGDPGRRMWELIQRIAARLDMPTCKYPAHFVLNAFTMVKVQRTAVGAAFKVSNRGDKGFFEKQAVGSLDAHGNFYWKPIDSVAIQYLRYLAATFPPLRQLIELIFRYSAPRVSYAAWAAHWFEHVIERAETAAAEIWLYACQITMQQLLHSSMEQIEMRQRNLEDYTKAFTALAKIQLANLVEVIMLRDALARFISLAGDAHGQDAYDRVRERIAIEAALRYDFDARKAKLLSEIGNGASLVTMLADDTQYVFRRGASNEKGPVLAAGQIVEAEGGGWAIYSSDGKLRSLEQLDKLRALGTQSVTTLDPLLSQIMHDFASEIRPLVDDPTKIGDFVSGLLDAMHRKNEEVARDNAGDAKYAFEHGQFQEVEYSISNPKLSQPTVAGTRYILQGVHAMAHELVGHEFAGDAFYTSAIDDLIGHELGWRSLKADLVMFGSIAVGLICPPLGAAIGVIGGIILGIQDYEHAKEQEKIYGALINPEDVLSYAQIQVELFVAKLGIALSFLAAIPEVGSALKGIGAAGERLAEKGIEASARAIAREIIETQMAAMSKLVLENLPFVFAKELVKMEILNKVIEKALTPLIEARVEALKAELYAEGFQ